jgi:exodeoxyribonuclease VII large subunit
MAAESFFEFYERTRKRQKAREEAGKGAEGERSAGAVGGAHPTGAVGGARPAGGAPEAMTVSQLTVMIERAVRTLPQRLLVRGEVSNFSRHGPSGHLYFTLKDPGACVDCVMYRSDAARLKFGPQDGMELLASGRVDIYRQRGRYQFYATRLEPLGQGALELAFQQLRAKLDAEGLFGAERKKALPLYPASVALVTSLQTAAVQDMLKVLAGFGWVRVMIHHVPVQGEGAAEQIAAALAQLNREAQRLGGIDVILLGRGGGSLEDLWEFNEEVVARAIVASDIPIVTGIGHEVDVSIADLAADYHAHTPTEAATVAMRHWRAAPEALDALGIRLRREIRTLAQDARQRLRQLEQSAVFRRPTDRINAARQFLDDRQRALTLGLVGRLRRGQETLGRAESQLREHHPRHLTRRAGQKVEEMARRSERAVREDLRRRGRELDALAGHLAAVGPEQVLRRGYSITMLKKTSQVVKSAAALKSGDVLVTRLADGSVQSTVDDARQLKLFE